MRVNTIAIDGPAGSGKSSVSKEVARRLGFNYLDTGAFYRAFGLWAHARGITPAQLEAPQHFQALVADFQYAVVTEPPEQFSIAIEEQDYTEEIRSGEAAVLAGRVAQHPEVRRFLTSLFQAIIEPDPDSGLQGFVLEGRDTTTNIAPDAELRVFLTAAEEVRMARRRGESQGSGPVSLNQQITERDRGDTPRLVAAETAEGVQMIDTTHLSFEEVVQRILELFQRVRT